MTLRNKVILTFMLIANIVTMFFNWFGFSGANEIPGTIVLFNPITLLCIVLFLIGVWYLFKITKANTWMPILSIVGIIGVKVHALISWHYISGVGIINLFFSFKATEPAFHIGFTISITILFLLVFFARKNSLSQFI